MTIYAENLIASYTVGAGGISSISFTSIPQTYTDLVIRISGRDNDGGITSLYGLAFNGNTLASNKELYSTGSATGLGTTGGETGGAGNGATANVFGNAEVYIPNYTGSKQKNFNSDYVGENNATYNLVEFIAGTGTSFTAAITSISITPGGTLFNQYTTAYLYGIKNAQSGITTKATGGDSIVTSGGYTYHVFRTTGTFTPTQNLSADILVVAGGGGGGYYYGGGGGAGGLLGFSSQSLTSGTPYTCTVGAGGAARTSAGQGNNGSNSQFGSLTACVGGGGGGGNGGSGASGGSGGGSSQSGSAGAGTAGQGNSGGTGGYDGGGGGAAAAGTTGYGGAGSSAYSAWGLATGTGHNVSGTVYYAGGGNGQAYGDAVNGGGGSGNYPTGTYHKYGLPNTGGGGAGDGNGSGGSGIIIVRYAS